MEKMKTQMKLSKNQLVKAWTWATLHLCVFDDSETKICQCLTFPVYQKVKQIAGETYDRKILAKVSEGCMINVKAKYDCKCFLSYYSKASSITSPDMQHYMKIKCSIVFEADLFALVFCWVFVYFWKNNWFWKNEGLLKLMVLVLLYTILLFLSNGLPENKIKKCCVIYIMILLFHTVINLRLSYLAHLFYKYLTYFNIF